jgi:hypothetical protein
MKMITREQADREIQQQYNRCMDLVGEKNERIEELEGLLEIAPCPASVLRKVDELLGENKTLKIQIQRMAEAQEVFCEWLGDGEKEKQKIIAMMGEELVSLRKVAQEMQLALNNREDDNKRLRLQQSVHDPDLCFECYEIPGCQSCKDLECHNLKKEVEK